MNNSEVKRRILSFGKRKPLLLLAFLSGIVISLRGLWNFWPTTLPHSPRNSTGEKQWIQTCASGSFILKGMDRCHPWLRCNEINTNVTVTDKYLGTGSAKIVKKGSWRGYPVAVNFLKHINFFGDFQHNLDMLHMFSKEPGSHVNRVVQLVGWCFKPMPIIISEMHQLGSANRVHTVLKYIFPELDTLAFRFGLCINFVQILDILHSHSGGPRVLCDANDPGKALSQFLLSENISLVLNDMDALPVVNRSAGTLIKCGNKELSGDYVAPEQLWPYDEMNYNDDIMPHYDEKIDIWKIPDICNFLVGNMTGAGTLQLHLFNIHSQCKQEDPQRRPTVKKVLKYYEMIRQKMI